MDDLLEFAQQVEGWHKHKVDNLHAVIENIKEGVTLMFGDDGEQLKLDADQALYFKLGLTTALGEFEELPFTLTNNTEDELG